MTNGTASWQEAYNQAIKGSEAWNKWNSENPGREVDFSDITFDKFMDFEDFIFLENVKFENATFHGANFRRTRFLPIESMISESENFASFDNAEFDGPTDFRETEFNGHTVSFLSTKFSDILFSDANDSDNCSIFNVALTDFTDAKFMKTAWMGTVKFCGQCKFVRTEFQDSTYFNGSSFTKYTSFRNAKFKADVSFRGVKFVDRFFFRGGEFGGLTDFANTDFEWLPDFRDFASTHQITLHNVKIRYQEHADKEYGIFRKAAEAEDASKYRRLKELADDAKDHASALDFFADELRAKRFYEAGKRETALIYLYQFFSNFGRSALRPFTGLAAVWLFFSFFFGRNLPCERCYPTDFADGYIFSGANLVPFLAKASGAAEASKGVLFGKPPETWVYVASGVEGVLGIILIFLLGLVLRNTLRL